MSIFSPSRCVLLLSDEGINIYDAGGSRTSLLEMVPWENEDFEEAVSDIILKKCRGKSIVVLNDMVEQHYRKERVPKVGPLDKANVLKRRLSAAFPSFPIRAAMKLKEKAPVQKDAQLPPGEIYLFGAVPLSANITHTLGAVQKTFATLAGFSLLPVESSGMVQALSKKLTKSADKQSVWTVFVGQHRNGGLRQIVTKNGELALTRMTPLMDLSGESEGWAAEVTNEIKGTMGYLGRFGFDQRDGLDVVVIANNSVADRIVSRIDFECNLNVLTTAEAGNLLKLPLGRQEDQHHSDALHVAWTGRKPRVTMPLHSPQLDNISKPVQYAMAACLILFLMACYFGYMSFTQASTWSENSNKIVLAQQTLAVTKKEHEEEVAKKAAIGIDFLLIEKSTKTYETLDLKTTRPLPVFDLIGKSLGPDIHLSSLEVKAYVPVPGATSAQETPVDPENPDAVPVEPRQKYDVIVRITFPAALAPEKGVREIADLEQRLRSNLPNHEVKIVKQVADLSYTGNFVGEATSQINEAQGQPKQDYVAEILIRGELI